MSDTHLVTHEFWEDNYSAGRSSGPGSEGEFAEWKAAVVNDVIERYDVTVVLDVGCGDGQQAALIECPRYYGIDVSPTAVDMCRDRFFGDPMRYFDTCAPGQLPDGMFDLVMSLEVLMHILEEDVFVSTLSQMFTRARHTVLIQAPLVPMVEYRAGAWDKHRPLLPYLSEYLPYWVLSEILIHPASTPESRARGEIGEMAADFLVFRRAKA